MCCLCARELFMLYTTDQVDVIFCYSIYQKKQVFLAVGLCSKEQKLGEV